MAYGVRLKDEATGAIISFLRNSATAERTYNLPDRDLLAADFGLARTAVAFVETAANGGSDSTGILGLYNRPFATITGALNALPSTGGIIYIGIGDFDAPADDVEVGSVLKNNVAYIGAKMPWLDSTYTVNTFPTIPSFTAPTKLQNGTVIKGRIAHIGRNNIIFKNLGVDVGSAFCTATGGSYASGGNCITFSDANSGTGSAPTTISKGIVIDNVVLLGQSATSAFHGLVLESSYMPRVSNVYTFFNTWGIAIKTQHGIFENIFCNGHTSGDIIFKGDVYAGCQGNLLNNFQLGSLGSFDSGGLTIEGGTGPIYKNIIQNGYIFGTTYGVRLIGSQAVLLNKIQNVMVSSCSGAGFRTSGTGIQSNEFIDCTAQACGAKGFDITTTAANHVISLISPKAYNNTGEGVLVSAGAIVYINGIVSTGNSTYGLNNAGTCKRDGSYYSGNTTAAENGTITGTA